MARKVGGFDLKGVRNGFGKRVRKGLLLAGNGVERRMEGLECGEGTRSVEVWFCYKSGLGDC